MELLNQSDKIAERTSALAHKYAKNVGLKVRNFLGQYGPQEGVVYQVLEQFTIHWIAVAEEQKAIKQYTEARNAGKHNDRRSIGKGLTALVRPSVKQAYEEHFSATGPDFDAPIFDEPRVVNGEAFYPMRLREG